MGICCKLKENLLGLLLRVGLVHFFGTSLSTSISQPKLLAARSLRSTLKVLPGLDLETTLVIGRFLPGWFRGLFARLHMEYPRRLPTIGIGEVSNMVRACLLLGVHYSLCPSVQALIASFCGANKKVRKQAFKRLGN